MKTGIVCDDHKVARFEKELKNGGFDKYVVTSYSVKNKISLIKVFHEDDRLEELGKLIRKTEKCFRNLN